VQCETVGAVILRAAFARRISLSFASGETERDPFDSVPRRPKVGRKAKARDFAQDDGARCFERLYTLRR
jgi:hypothetical protein